MLRLENITYGVEGENGGREIIKGLDLTVRDGTFLAVTGPNGGGKSTTAKLIMGIEKPSGGRIFFDENDITEASITDRAKMGIGFAFPKPAPFFRRSDFAQRII